MVCVINGWDRAWLLFCETIPWYIMAVSIGRSQELADRPRPVPGDGVLVFSAGGFCA